MIQYVLITENKKLIKLKARAQHRANMANDFNCIFYIILFCEVSTHVFTHFGGRD